MNCELCARVAQVTTVNQKNKVTKAVRVHVCGFERELRARTAESINDCCADNHESIIDNSSIEKKNVNVNIDENATVEEADSLSYVMRKDCARDCRARDQGSSTSWLASLAPARIRNAFVDFLCLCRQLIVEGPPSRHHWRSKGAKKSDAEGAALIIAFIIIIISISLSFVSCRCSVEVATGKTPKEARPGTVKWYRDHRFVGDSDVKAVTLF